MCLLFSFLMKNLHIWAGRGRALIQPVSTHGCFDSAKVLRLNQHARRRLNE